MGSPKVGERSYWQFRKYDVIGNKKDGYEVNDVHSHGTIECPLHDPSASWLASLVGLRNFQITMEYNGTGFIYVSRQSDSKPLFEVQREE